MKSKNLIDKIEKFLLQYNLIRNNNQNIAIAFSGGFDSMSLIYALIQLRKTYHFNLFAFHLNHNWRKEESLREMKICQDFCESNNITFYTETLDESEKHTETRARELRYDFFDRAISIFKIDALLTAHTKSDTVETLIYRTIKGTGIKGLQGISPNLGKIYRPMLDISRKDVELYCKENHLSPNNDSSNQKNDYSRNYIRNEILPKFSKINMNYEEAINSLSILAFEEEQIIKEYIEHLQIYDDLGYIKTNIFKTLSDFVKKRIIYELFVKFDFEYTQQRILNTLEFIERNMDSKSGKKYSLDSKHWLFVNVDKIYVITKTEKILDEVIVTKEGNYNIGNYIFKIEKCNKSPCIYPKDSEFQAYIELNEDINFILRTRRNGDIIQPLGSNGCMKLKKYFINKNIAQHKRDNIVLLCKSSEIFWVSGFGLSDKIKVVNNCTHVIKLYNKD